jgi:3'(2'), 5'-bisphosphate nucleotidase
LDTHDMIETFLGTAIQAAYRAGLKILEVYHTDFSVSLKADQSPLTMADTTAHREIRSLLDILGLPVLSEEGRDIPYAERRQWRRFWMVDPLDGTKEFVKRNDQFTVNIALMQDDRPILGVVYVPVGDTLYFGAEGLGAYKCQGLSTLFEKSDDPAPSLFEPRVQTVVAHSVRLPAQSASRRNFTVVASRSHASEPLRAYLAMLEADHPGMTTVSAGSSLKFCLVAEGAADQYPRLGPTMEWDTAAGQVIVECAGGRVLEYDRGEPLRYNKENLLNPWFVVTP